MNRVEPIAVQRVRPYVADIAVTATRLRLYLLPYEPVVLLPESFRVRDTPGLTTLLGFDVTYVDGIETPMMALPLEGVDLGR